MQRRRITRAHALRLSLLSALGVLTPGCSGELGGSKTVTDGCTSPSTDAATGLVLCAEGYSHRPAPKTCGAAGVASGVLPRAKGEDCTGETSVCEAYAFGYCRAGFGPPGSGYCDSGCVTDADCSADFICVCSGQGSPTGGVCVSSSCQRDADCGSGRLCATFNGSCGELGFACQSGRDECGNDSDCNGSRCTLAGTYDDGGTLIEEHRACSPGCSIGRPFLVDDTPRLAPLQASSAWTTLAVSGPQVERLGWYERAELSRHWARLGQMEHASIAAFARFQLQLLALGAPLALVEACTCAMADETEHAKLCFSIAQAYAGHEVGPGPLDVAGSVTAVSLAGVVDLVIAEGCFGETSAVLEALELAETSDDAFVQAVHLRIADDEQRHAELAFKFVRWALEQDPVTVRRRIEAARVSDYGQSEAARSVVLPCLIALLARSSSPPVSAGRDIAA